MCTITDDIWSLSFHQFDDSLLIYIAPELMLSYTPRAPSISTGEFLSYLLATVR